MGHIVPVDPVRRSAEKGEGEMKKLWWLLVLPFAIAYTGQTCQIIFNGSAKKTFDDKKTCDLWKNTVIPIANLSYVLGETSSSDFKEKMDDSKNGLSEGLNALSS